MKKLIIKLIIILFIFTFMNASYASIDFSVLAKVFDAPFGYDPILQSAKLNGINELKVTFKTEVPYILLKEYYSTFLSNEGWNETSVTPEFNEQVQLFDDLFFKMPSKLFYMKEGKILLLSYLETEDGNYFSLSFMDGIPSMNLSLQDIDFNDINNLIMPGIKPLLNYSSESNIGMNAKFNFFQTNASSEYVIDFYKYNLLNYGWHENTILHEFKSEIKQIAGLYGQSPINIDNICILQKDDGTLLFLFVIDVPENLGTTFGYFVKSFSNDKSQED